MGIYPDFTVQPSTDGMAEALLIGERFLDLQFAALVLGDSILHGSGLACILSSGVATIGRRHVVAHRVADPHPYGVVEFDEHRWPVSLDEKLNGDVLVVLRGR